MSQPFMPVDLSPPSRSSSRARFDQAAINAFKDAVAAGRSVGDGQPVEHQSTAYQRAKTLCERLGTMGVQAEPVTWKENQDDPNSKYQWAVRPRNSTNTNATNDGDGAAASSRSAAAAKAAA